MGDGIKRLGASRMVALGVHQNRERVKQYSTAPPWRASRQNANEWRRRRRRAARIRVTFEALIVKLISSQYISGKSQMDGSVFFKYDNQQR